MKPSLQLKIGQQLTMTPQLQQAIKLLQLSSLELQSEIQEALETNPMLEVAEDVSEDPSVANNDKIQESQQDDSTIATDQAMAQESLNKDQPLDTQWENWDAAPPSSGSSNSYDKDSNFEYQGKTTESLQDHLYWQMNLTPFSERDLTIATAIIDSIEDDGYLMSSLDDICESLGDDTFAMSIEDGMTLDETQEFIEQEILAVLHRIQHFDPIGVGARNLSECLSIQIAQFDPELQEVQDAKLLLNEYFDDLGTRNYKEIIRKSKLGEPRVREALKCIQKLDPKPGHAISNVQADYVTPDVYV
ncbi:MAG: RNA polymerase factor sigma-54, partial [Gammaproteobacteria bacterium]|nr:RNA polymerase factor sigma-54 [Gammaproteobacteria bacterium]NNJ73102.1 RNA polymerase factor sigma-54 [Enterobacterales bacterium]